MEVRSVWPFEFPPPAKQLSGQNLRNTPRGPQGRRPRPQPDQVPDSWHNSRPVRQQTRVAQGNFIIMDPIEAVRVAEAEAAA